MSSVVNLGDGEIEISEHSTFVVGQKVSDIAAAIALRYPDCYRVLGRGDDEAGRGRFRPAGAAHTWVSCLCR
jgi:hypothetical protein